MKKKLIAVLLGVSILAGCSNFVNNTRKSEIVTTHLVYGSYVAWTNYYTLKTNSYAPDSAELARLEQYRLMIKQARQDYAASIGVLDSWLTAYESNIVTKAQVQSVINSTLANSSNVVYLIKFIQTN